MREGNDVMENERAAELKPKLSEEERENLSSVLEAIGPLLNKITTNVIVVNGTNVTRYSFQNVDSDSNQIARLLLSAIQNLSISIQMYKLYHRR